MNAQRGVMLAVLAGLALSAPARAETAAWDHNANIKDAAERLVKLHRREGSPGVMKFLDACYRTHTLAAEFSQGLEACMAQDYMHSKVLAQIYAKLPDASRAKPGLPTPKDIADAMGRRFVAAFSQYKVPVKDAEAFKTRVDEVGFPVFVKGVFPKKPEGETAPDAKSK